MHQGDTRGGSATSPRGIVRQQIPRSEQRRRRRRARAETIAAEHGGVMTRAMLLAAGVTREDIRTELRAGVWVARGVHTIALGPQPLEGEARFWWAVWESGAHAVLDGVSALLVAGLTGWTEKRIWVSVPVGSTLRPLEGVRRHHLREPGPVLGARLPHTTPAVAVVRAAQWADADRQAATLLAMTIQQRLARSEDVLEVWRAVRRSPRRRFLDEVVNDVCRGAESLNELDVARLCRQHGLPEPTRQHVRRGERGRVYLDVYWEAHGVHLEIHGAHHFEGTRGVDDALRANDQAIRHPDDIQLVLPVLGLRTDPDRFMAQIRRALAEGARRRRRGSAPAVPVAHAG